MTDKPKEKEPPQLVLVRTKRLAGNRSVHIYRRKPKPKGAT